MVVVVGVVGGCGWLVGWFLFFVSFLFLFLCCSHTSTDCVGGLRVQSHVLCPYVLCLMSSCLISPCLMSPCLMSHVLCLHACLMSPFLMSSCLMSRVPMSYVSMSYFPVSYVSMSYVCVCPCFFLLFFFSSVKRLALPPKAPS